MERITEQPSLYRHLEKMSVDELVTNINREDQKVVPAIEKEMTKINKMITVIEGQLRAGGRLVYLGAGSGGRLSVLDKVELPNIFGIEKDVVICLLAGGEENLLQVLEEKEDDSEDALRQMDLYQINEKDFVLGISASGSTPYVLDGLKKCRELNIPCGCIVNNPDSPIAAACDYPIEVVTGPEFISGSTRMKCGTVQKMLYDLIGTTLFIRLGRVEDNRMVNVRLTNNKTLERSVKMLQEKRNIDNYEEAKKLVIDFGSVKKAMDFIDSQQ